MACGAQSNGRDEEVLSRLLLSRIVWVCVPEMSERLATVQRGKDPCDFRIDFGILMVHRKEPLEPHDEFCRKVWLGNLNFGRVCKLAGSFQPIRYAQYRTPDRIGSDSLRRLLRGWATASIVSRYFPSCRTFEFSDGRHLTGWHARLGTGEHVVQLRSREYAVFDWYSAMHPAEEAVDCDFEYVRPVDRR